MQRLKVFLTAERSIDWAKLLDNISGAFAKNTTPQDSNRTRRWGVFLKQIKPLWFVNVIRNALLVCTVVILAYTYLAIERLPRFSDTNQSVSLFQVQDIQNAASYLDIKNLICLRFNSPA